MHRIVVVDLGTGNLHSVAKAFEKVAPSAHVEVTSDLLRLEKADRVVLPGQGAIGSWFKALDERQLRNPVLGVLSSKPVLGICVGMQALFNRSEEDGGCEGLGLFDGEVRRFCRSVDRKPQLKVPHMGWNNVRQSSNHPVWRGISQDARFYFVHSYYALATQSSSVAATSDYGGEFVSAIARANIFAVQFHPEKSHEQGLKLLENFVCWDGDA